jgi:hypothetical protein
METPMLSYPTAAPIFADADYMAEIIGEAQTADEAKARYAAFYADSGVVITAAMKAQPERSSPVTTRTPAASPRARATG